MSVIAGNPSLVSLPVDYESDGKGNLVAVMRWRGTVSAIQSFLPYVNTPGVRVTMRHDEPPFATLEARPGDAADGTPPDSDLHVSRNTFWFLDGNDLEKPITDHPSLTEDDAGEIAYKAQIAQEDGVYSNFFGTFSNPAAEAIFRLIAKKVESWSVSQFVLRRQVTVPGFYSGNYANSNANRQFTKAQLQSMEALPAALFFEIPAAGAWLKRTPSMRQLEDGRWEITNEWWHGDSIPVELYPPAS